MGAFMDKVVKTATYYIKVFQKRLRRWALPVVRPTLKRPIFVVGCSRAGTTLIYKTFSESEKLGSLQRETHDFWAALHPPSERDWTSHVIPVEMACHEDIKEVSNFFYAETGETRVVDKNNQNGLSIPYLYKLFPDAHFVFIKRCPGDNINSLIVGWSKSNEFGDWAEALPERIAVDDGYFDRWCFFLAEGWRDYLNNSIEEVCAFQYKMMNQAILSAKPLVPKAQWHEVTYEKLIENPVVEFEKIFNECEVSFDEKIRKHCEEVLQKPYNTFSSIEVNKWRKGENRARIERILPMLTELEKRLGY